MSKRIQIIPKDILFPEAIVLDNSENRVRELYDKANRKTAEKFGKNSLAYKTITNGIDMKNVTGSQFFWNTELGKYLPKNLRVITLKDMEQINDINKDFFKGFYTDASMIILRTEVPTWDDNKHILDYLVKQVKEKNQEFSSENPLIISGLELIKDENTENHYGLLLQIGEETAMINDKRFGYSNNQKKIPFGEKTKKIYAKKDGLSRLCLDRSSNLNSFVGVLAGSDSGGRVVLVDTEGVSQTFLDKKLTELQTQKDAQIEKINLNYQKAKEILKAKENDKN